MRKKSKEDEHTLTDLSSVHLRSQAKCQLVQTSYIKGVTSWFAHIEKFSLNFLNSSFVIRVNLFHP